MCTSLIAGLPRLTNRALESAIWWEHMGKGSVQPAQNEKLESDHKRIIGGSIKDKSWRSQKAVDRQGFDEYQRLGRKSGGEEVCFEWYRVPGIICIPCRSELWEYWKQIPDISVSNTWMLYWIGSRSHYNVHLAPHALATALRLIYTLLNTLETSFTIHSPYNEHRFEDPGLLEKSTA